MAQAKTRAKPKSKQPSKPAKDAGQAVGKAASKAKTPLLAGGAALAAAAGGLAVGMKMSRGKRLKIRRRDVARAAKEVGSFGQQVGELATELRHVREDSGNGGKSNKHRSPIEVVLDGLTARH